MHDRWISAEREGRGLDVLDFCVADVAWMVPGRDILVGREAVSCLLSKPTTEILKLETSDIRIQGSGTMAYKTSRYRTLFRVIEGGQEQITQGQHLWILHKESDDRWRVAFVTWQEAE